jgi:Na+-transporting methylmalonyl-CoA/oxaloacetate decarboxylase gamma subunit
MFKGVDNMQSLNVGDVLYQLVLFLVLIAVIVGVGLLVKRAVSTDRRLKRIEEKVDELKDEKGRDRT